MVNFESFRNDFYNGFGYETARVLLENAPDNFKEVTPIVEGTHVIWWDDDLGNYRNGEVTEITDERWATVEENDGAEWEVLLSECERDESGVEEIPAYFYRASDSAMQSALESENVRIAAAKAGFRVWETPDDTQISRDCTDTDVNNAAFKDFYEAYMKL